MENVIFEFLFLFVCLLVVEVLQIVALAAFFHSLSLSLSWEISEKLLQLLWMRGREWKVLFNDQNFRHTPKKIALFKMKLFRGKKTFSRLLHFRCCRCKGRSLSSRQLHQPKTRISKEFDLTQHSTCFSCHQFEVYFKRTDLKHRQGKYYWHCRGCKLELWSSVATLMKFSHLFTFCCSFALHLW